MCMFNKRCSVRRGDELIASPSFYASRRSHIYILLIRLLVQLHTNGFRAASTVNSRPRQQMPAQLSILTLSHSLSGRSITLVLVSNLIAAINTLARLASQRHTYAQASAGLDTLRQGTKIWSL